MNTNEKMVVLDPTEGPVEAENHLAPRLSEVDGKRIVFINNGKRNSEVLLSALAEELKRRHRLEIIWIDKKNPSLPFPEAMLEQLRSSHGVIAGIGD